MPDDQTPIDREGVRTEIRAAVAPLLTEMKWQRWILGALIVGVFSPKLGGPAPPEAKAVVESIAAAVGKG